MNYCAFNIQPLCSDVSGDHRRPQTLAEMCRNMGICYGFRSVTARVEYPGLIIEVLALLSNYANPVYGVATICHQVRCLRWGHPSLFHTATSLLIWYKMFCMRNISYILTWMKSINMVSVSAQSGTHRCVNWWIIAVLTYNPSVLMCVEITDAPKL